MIVWMRKYCHRLTLVVELMLTMMNPNQIMIILRGSLSIQESLRPLSEIILMSIHVYRAIQVLKTLI